MKVWVSRRPNGSYMLTGLRPVRKRVAGTDREDLYLRPGEPVGLGQPMCPEMSEYVLREGGVVENGLEPFEMVRVELHIRPAGSGGI